MVSANTYPMEINKGVSACPLEELAQFSIDPRFNVLDKIVNDAKEDDNSIYEWDVM